MFMFLRRLVIAMSISISSFCYALEINLENSEFIQTWNDFLNSKEMLVDHMSVEEQQDYEFYLLQEFSQRQAIRFRPCVQAIDRFSECRPYFDNKMTLSDGSEMSASFIQLAHQTTPYHNFVATQAPLKQHIHLFWQMIVENHIDQIIMLTELFENPLRELCSLYWPNQMNQKLVLENGIEITLIEERELLSELKESIQIRQFNLCSSGDNRKVTHYWYRNWLDGTAPSHSQTILTLIKTIESAKHETKSSSPILVHCAAGIGRTGVFITLYHLMQRAKREDHKIDLFDLIAYLRWQRPYMVAANAQYKFCHQVHATFQE